ncbi:aluminum-activated malate transporter 1-like [Dorcoceras hygrometricum]|uniref:Aluminum-activated malate transporter 1-like n=1 Tax=Dorcoceras hygrometricum TaxID=472368 RepID=A0A2Z7AQY5_9LAMI|nr:aluminum-activated malate transporter 1-like [Dorcoceras hygrometricum]
MKRRRAEESADGLALMTSSVISSQSADGLSPAVASYCSPADGIKATTESWEPKDINNSSTARSDEWKDSQWPRGILSTWELPTHLQYTVPDANRKLHLLLPTHEMWELPTPLIAANKPSREMRDTGVTRSASEGHGNYPLGLEYSILTTQGRFLRPPHQLQANVRKAISNEASQQEEPNATTLTSIGSVYRRQSKNIRSCNRSHPKPKQISTNSNDVAENYCRNWTCHPLLTAEQLTNICSQRNIRSLTQLKLT